MSLRPASLNIQNRLKKLQGNLDGVPAKAYNKFKTTTPIRTGNARRNTNFTATQTGGEIAGDYPYANRLNEGYSRQAPAGMTKPTIDYLRSVVRKLLG